MPTSKIQSLSGYNETGDEVVGAASVDSLTVLGTAQVGGVMTLNSTLNTSGTINATASSITTTGTSQINVAVPTYTSVAPAATSSFTVTPVNGSSNKINQYIFNAAVKYTSTLVKTYVAVVTFRTYGASELVPVVDTCGAVGITFALAGNTTNTGCKIVLTNGSANTLYYVRNVTAYDSQAAALV